MQYAPRVNSLKGRGAGLRGDQCPGVPLQLSVGTAFQMCTHTLRQTDTPSQLEFPSHLSHHTIKVPSCSTWSPTAEKRRQVREEKDQFNILFVFSLSLSCLHLTLHLLFLLFYLKMAAYESRPAVVSGPIWHASDCYLTLKI